MTIAAALDEHREPGAEALGLAALRDSEDGRALYELLAEGKRRNASDLQIVFGVRSVVNIDGELESVFGGKPLSNEAFPQAMRCLFGKGLPGADREIRRRCLDGGGDDAEIGRVRLHVHRVRDGFALDVRYLRDDIPTLAQMLAPEPIYGLARVPQGVVYVTGPTGSGKTSLMAAMLRYMYDSRPDRILTYEDPIEYIHPSHAIGFVSQAEKGRDFTEYREALRGAMRAAPRVVLVGEIRDKETAEACLALGETGHLVLATLHVGETTNIPRRMLSFFPGHEQAAARVQLAETFSGAVGMRLVPRAKPEGGRRPVYEILLRHSTVESAFESVDDGKGGSLRNVLQGRTEDGMRTLEQHLSYLWDKGEITEETARRATFRHDELKRDVQFAFKE